MSKKAISKDYDGWVMTNITWVELGSIKDIANWKYPKKK